MTTNRRVQRDRHPARSARILTTGIAVASTLGISSALTLAAHARVSSEVAKTPALAPSLSGVRSVSPSAPTSPAAATPAAPNQLRASAVDPTQPAVTTVPVAPQIIDVPLPAAPQGGWAAPATSGSN